MLGNLPFWELSNWQWQPPFILGSSILPCDLSLVYTVSVDQSGSVSPSMIFGLSVSFIVWASLVLRFPLGRSAVVVC